jgi:hypothetical protein
LGRTLDADIDIMSLALHLQAMLHGGSVVTEAAGYPQAARDSGQH